MNSAIATIKEFSYIYEIHHDEHEVQDLFNGRAMDFEDEQDKEQYLNKFRNDTLSAYGVVKKEKCSCCENYKFIDSLWGIHAETYEEALKFFQQHYER